MNITVRLYKLHDYDLIYLYKNLRFPIRDAMKKSLYAYVRNDPVFFEFPVQSVENDNLIRIKNSQIHLILDEKEDADILEFLTGIKKYYRNSFLKNLLRGYLAGPAVFVYETDPDMELTADRIENIQDLILHTEELPLMKARKKKKYITLTEDQVPLFKATGAFDDVDIVIKK